MTTTTHESHTPRGGWRGAACLACGAADPNFDLPAPCLKPGSVQSFTKTETLRRLRVAARLMRETDYNIAKNFRMEVGTRVEATSFPTVEDALAAKDNDLDTFWSLVDACDRPEVMVHGYVANIYASSTGWSGELYDVQNVWLGTPDHEPVLLHNSRGLVYA